MLNTAVPPSSSSALDKAPQLDWDNYFNGKQTHSNELLSEEDTPGLAVCHLQTERVVTRQPLHEHYSSIALNVKMIAFRKRAKIEMLIPYIPALGKRAFSSLALNVVWKGVQRQHTLSGL